jgi:hypothetical protein
VKLKGPRLNKPFVKKAKAVTSVVISRRNRKNPSLKS